MMDASSGWYACMLLICIVGAVLHRRHDSFTALGIVVVLSFACPVWLRIIVMGVPIDVRTGAALAGLAAFVLRDAKWIRSPLTLIDIAVASLVLVNIASDLAFGRPPVNTAAIAYGEWAVPYVAGRFAMRAGNAAERLAWWTLGVVLILSAGGIFESITRVNPWELVFGERPFNDVYHNILRWGFRRAYGTCLHPTFFCILVLALLPWPLMLISWVESAWGKAACALSAGIACAGSLASMSRTAALGILFLFSIATALWIPKSRWIFALGVVTLAGMVAVDPMLTVNYFEEMVGEDEARVRTLDLHGDDTRFTSTSSHLLVLKAYWPALRGAGLLGYGTEAVDAFPPNVPHLPPNAKTLHNFRWPDNAYLLMGLRFGWLGVAALVFFLAATIRVGVQVMDDRSVGVATGWMSAMFATVLLLFWLVWLSYDFGFVLLWSSGIVSGISSSMSGTIPGRREGSLRDGK